MMIEDDPGRLAHAVIAVLAVLVVILAAMLTAALDPDPVAPSFPIPPPTSSVGISVRGVRRALFSTASAESGMAASGL
jgi:hypothetical protein